MKIKLQNYSLISNEWIDRRINQIEQTKDMCSLPEQEELYNLLENEKQTLEYTKQQLIPSEKLATAVYDQCTVIGTALSFREQEQHKPIYLNSEIEIDEK